MCVHARARMYVCSSGLLPVLAENSEIQYRTLQVMICHFDHSHCSYFEKHANSLPTGGGRGKEELVDPIFKVELYPVLLLPLSAVASYFYNFGDYHQTIYFYCLNPVCGQHTR